jgi:UDP-glucose 4-epimerase
MKKHTKKTILITGGAGYIGSFLVNFFKKKFKIFIIDDLSLGKKIQIRSSNFFKFNLCHKEKIDSFFKKNSIDIVFHLAGHSNLRLSNKQKKKFYLNNYIATKNIVNASIKYNVKKFIFSSTASVYGNRNITFTENSACRPISIYGKSKLNAENYIKKKSKKNFSCIIFRFFNVAGASIKERLGERKNPPEHFIPIITKSLISSNKITLFNGFKTEDGTGIRDYVHVSDIIQAFKRALNYFPKMKKKYEVFNLGSNSSISSLKILIKLFKFYNKKVPIFFKKKGYGEPDKLLSSIVKAKKILNWKPKKNINKILKDSVSWEEFIKLDKYRGK